MEQKRIPKSTHYDHRAKLYRLSALQIWAGCAKARMSGADLPSIEAIFGSTTRVIRVWKHWRTGELRTSVECPGGEDKAWLKVSECELNLPQKGAKLCSAVELMYLSVDKMLKFSLSPKDQQMILKLLPITGAYQGLPYRAKERDRHLKEATVENPMPDTNTFSTYDEMLDWLEGPGNCRAIRNAMRVLYDHAIIGPQEGEQVTYTMDRDGQTQFFSPPAYGAVTAQEARRLVRESA